MKDFESSFLQHNEKPTTKRPSKIITSMIKQGSDYSKGFKDGHIKGQEESLKLISKLYELLNNNSFKITREQLDNLMMEE